MLCCVHKAKIISNAEENEEEDDDDDDDGEKKLQRQAEALASNAWLYFICETMSVICKNSKALAFA